MLYKRYKMLQKYINGEAQEEYKQGELISDTTFNTLDACNEGNQKPDESIEGNIYQWVTISNDYVCNGKDKYTKEKEQTSSDGGKTWIDTGRTRQGDLIQANSDDCSVSEQYLTFIPLEDCAFSIQNNFDDSETILYSLDEGLNWNILKFKTSTPKVTSGNKILLKGKLSYVNDRGIGWFISTGKFNIKGNIMSLLYGDDFIGKTEFPKNTPGEFPFSLLFVNTDVVDASKLVLPATTLTEHCYSHMFEGCTNLVNAPRILPAMTLAENCYDGMFYGCTSLTTAPELPATTLAVNCYNFMFNGCTNLVNAPELPATTLTRECYYAMFQGCTSLTTAPELPALNLVYECYNNMFRDCSSLNYIKTMFVTKPGTDYTYNWVRGVASSGRFVKNSAATWDVTGNNGIPTGWTVINE